jgi:AcrR family transcriptional regulator
VATIELMSSTNSGGEPGSTNEEVRQYAPRTGPRVRRGTAPALLLAAAQELFAERGPRATTTREIAERADVSEDLIFRYFGSKNGLLHTAVIQPIIDLLESTRGRWAAQDCEQPGSEHERAVTFVGQLYDMVHGNRTVVQTMVQVLNGAPGELDDSIVRRLSNELFEPLVPMFTEYLEQQGFRSTDPGLQLRLSLILIGATAAFLPGTYPATEDAPGKDRIVEVLVVFISNGLRAG